MDDIQLIKKVKEGDRLAIKLLVDNHKNLIWHIIISMIGHKNEGEDIFQEVFLRVFKGLKRFRADARLSTWIGSIAHHVCVDFLRKKKRELEIISPDTDEKVRLNFSGGTNWKQADKDDINRIVLAAIAKLPPAYRTAITLYHLDERSYKEIGEITGMPDGTVKSYISRGRNLLRETLISFVPDIVEILDGY